jgi:hypothetical protein
MAYFSKKLLFFFFSIKNRSILGLRQKYFFLTKVVIVVDNLNLIQYIT